MRQTTSLVVALALLASLMGCGSSGGSSGTSGAPGAPGAGVCPNDTHWDYHLVGLAGSPMPGTQYTYESSTVAMAEDGTFAVAWASDAAGDVGVHVQRHLADGSADGALIKVSPVAHPNNNRPAMAMNSAGRFVVAYGNSLGIFYALYDETGAVILPATLLPGSAAGAATLPDVAIAADGSGAIASSFTGTPNVVLVQFFDAAGAVAGPANPQSVPDNMMDPADEVIGGPAIAMSASGTYVVAWTSTLGVRFRNSNAAGAGIMTASPASHAGGMSPSASMAPDGRFVLGWMGAGALGFVQAYNAGAVTAGSLTTANQSGILVASTPPSAARFLDVAMNGDGNFAATWARDGAPFGVLVRRFDETGVPLADEVLVSGATVSPYYVPAIAASTCFDNHVVAWVDEMATVAEFQLYLADDDDDGQADDCCFSDAVTESFTPASDRTIHDASGDGVFTNLDPENLIGVRFGIENDTAQNSYEDIRVGFEFDVSAIPAGATIHSVEFTLAKHQVGSNTGPRIFELHAYVGNNAVELGDALADNLAAGPFPITGPNDGATHTEDVTAKVAELLAGGADSIGLLLRHEAVPVLPAQFESRSSMYMSDNVDAAVHPRLKINYSAP